MDGFEIKYINLYTSNTGLSKAEIDKAQTSATTVTRLEYNYPYMTYLSLSEKIKDGINYKISFGKPITADVLYNELFNNIPTASTAVIQKITTEALGELEFITKNGDTADKINIVGYTFGQLATFYNRLLDGQSNKVVYTEGKLDIYSIYALYILSKLGHNITAVDLSYSADKYALYNNFRLINNGMIGGQGVSMEVSVLNKLDSIDLDSIIEMIHCRAEQKPCLIHVVGEDLACKLIQALGEVKLNTPESLLLLEGGIPKPSYDEVNSVPRIQTSSVDQLIKRINWNMFGRKREYSDSATEFIKADIQRQNYTSLGKAMNRLIGFICLYNRYDIYKSTILCYGTLDSLSSEFLKYLALCGKTVIVIDVSNNNKAGGGVYTTEPIWTQLTLDTIVENHPYPSTVIQGTLAYGAATEINKLLYNGDTLGLYRTRQYQTCDISTLHTTIDEIKFLWDKEVTVRPSFQSSSDKVVVPVFYSKILGWSEGYTKFLSDLNTEHTIISFNPSDLIDAIQNPMQINHFADINGTTFKEQVPMYKNGRLDINAIMNYRTFRYRMLDIGVQRHILSKIDQLIREQLICHTGISDEEFIDLVLNTALNLGERYQQQLQWHDFTKQNPKLLILCQTMQEINIRESVIITLLHLCGWDVAILIPTGYNVLGQNIRQEHMQQHILGENKFDLNITAIYPSGKFPEEQKKKGFFSRLFN